MLKVYNYFLFALFLSISVFSQNISDKKYITIIPDSNYQAGWFWRFWLGNHWRDLWTTPIKVEILDLKDFDGGLIPIKKGGGLQTKSLRFKSKNGLTWKFRSLDKDPSKLLPPEFQKSIADELLKDQISSSNPYAPLVVSPILSSVGVLESKPRFMYLPDNSLLGEFREEFKDQFGTIEIHPDDYDDEDENFADAEDVKGTYKLFEHLEKHRDEKISSTEYLKARLVDLLLGDWDRHMDQWRWAKYEMNHKEIWYPIPRDRDQAFVKYDGILPELATYILPQLNSFDMDFPSIKSLTWNGRFLDRRILTEMNKRDWDSVTAFVQNSITDSVIENSIKQLPSKIYSLSENELKSKLVNRRNHLSEASNEFYILTNSVADIFCSSKDDIAFVSRLDNNFTEVRIFKRDGNSFNGKGEILSSKKFSNLITQEIRIYLNDGDDAAIVTGDCDVSPTIRIVGGEGKDELIDSSNVSGYFISLTPFHDNMNKTYFYDSGNKTKIVYSTGTCYDEAETPSPETLEEKYEPPVVDRGNKFIIFPLFGYNSDYGLIADLNLLLFNYDFRKDPFNRKHQLKISFATRFRKFSVAYNSQFISTPFRKSNLRINALATQQYFINYFGYGNESEYKSNLDKKEFYEVDQEIINIKPEFVYSLSGKLDLLFGISINHSNTKLENDSLLSGFRYDTYGSGELNLLGIHPAIEIDLRDNEYYPLNGFYSVIESEFFPGIFKSQKAFTKYTFDIRSYFTLNFQNQITLAIRTGGSKVIGTYPYFLGATLGGTENLRAYNKNRFSGDAAVFGQVELRMYLGYLKFIFNNKIGFNLFAETGRVFVKDETSDKWHPSYGGGFWVSYLQNELILSTYIAFSGESTKFSFGFGLSF